MPQLWTNDRELQKNVFITQAPDQSQITLIYSGRCLMGSRLMGSFGYWDQIEPDFPVPKNSLIPNLCV